MLETILKIILWVSIDYILLGFLTALFLSQTPYSENGLLRNTLFAVFYWIAAIRGML